MALFHRLSGYNDDGTEHTAELKIPAHQFAAGLREAVRGNVTRAALETFWGLAGADLDPIVAKFMSITDADPFVQITQRLAFIKAVDDWTMLAEQRVAITTEAIWDSRISGF